VTQLPSDVSLEFAAPAAAIALEAGGLIRDFYHRGVTTEYKGDVDLVTEADRASERLIGERLRARFPTHGIYGEEGTREHIDREYRWYVDPLDGTTNFAHGFPVFCVSLGLEHRPAGLAPDADGILIAGVVYDPTRDELFVAEKGKGAYLNGKKIHVSRADDLAECLVATGFPSRSRHQNPNVYFYQQVTLRSHGVRRAGSAALDLAYTACGRFDGYWEFNLNPWDTSAGTLLVLEAGGTVTTFDGGPFKLNSREVLATNGLILKEVITLFQDMFAGRNLDPVPTPKEFAERRAERAR
jgi:myo-inositol-1(or 4)-monophosphatase